MPRVVSTKVLKEYPNDTAWQSVPFMTRAERIDVVAGRAVVIVSDGVLHGIESEYVRPEVHSLMQVDRPVVVAGQLDRVVLWVDRPLCELQGTLVHQYITWGSQHAFLSKKSKPVPIPERPSCESRRLWYDVTGLEPGIGFWPMAQQYRHIIPANPLGLPCNHNLFDIHCTAPDDTANRALIPVLNSTLVALIKAFYGRYAGTEGNLKTEVIDVVMLEIPDPRNASQDVLARLESALASMQERRVTHLVEEALLDCHTAEEAREASRAVLSLPQELRRSDRHQLDDAVFELLGVSDPKRRADLIERLYREVTMHFRAIRIVEVQKMEQRRKAGGLAEPSPVHLAAGAWEHLDSELRKPLSAWLEEQTGKARIVSIPEGPVRLRAENDMFESTTVFVGTKPSFAHVCSSRAEAELLFKIASFGVRGPLSLPATEAECRKLSERLDARFNEAKTLFESVSEDLAGSEKLREQIVGALTRWFIHGKPTKSEVP